MRIGQTTAGLAAAIVLGIGACAWLPAGTVGARSDLFPDVQILCTGRFISEDECRAWGESHLPWAPSLPAEAEIPPLARLILAAGGDRCSADYQAADGRVLMTISIPCPAP